MVWSCVVRIKPCCYCTTQRSITTNRSRRSCQNVRLLGWKNFLRRELWMQCSLLYGKCFTVNRLAQLNPRPEYAHWHDCVMPSGKGAIPRPHSPGLVARCSWAVGVLVFIHMLSSDQSLIVVLHCLLCFHCCCSFTVIPGDIKFSAVYSTSSGKHQSSTFYPWSQRPVYWTQQNLYYFLYKPFCLYSLYIIKLQLHDPEAKPSHVGRPFRAWDNPHHSRCAQW